MYEIINNMGPRATLVQYQRNISSQDTSTGVRARGGPIRPETRDLRKTDRYY